MGCKAVLGPAEGGTRVLLYNAAGIAQWREALNAMFGTCGWWSRVPSFAESRVPIYAMRSSREKRRNRKEKPHEPAGSRGIQVIRNCVADPAGCALGFDDSVI